MSSFPAIEAKGLNKSYGAVPVLREFDLRVEGGELCGLLVTCQLEALMFSVTAEQ